MGDQPVRMWVMSNFITSQEVRMPSIKEKILNKINNKSTFLKASEILQ